jgi:hypothetical protein
MKEVQLQTECSFQVITELVGMYQQAVEYFEAKGDPRQAEFQGRLERMLVQPEVVEQLEESSGRVHRPATPESKQIRPSSPVFASEGILERHTKGTLQSLERTRKDLKQQHSALLLRLQRRAKTTAWKDRTHDSTQPSCESSFENLVEDFFNEAGKALSPLSSPQSSSPLSSPRGGSLSPISASLLDKLEREYDLIMEQTFAEKNRLVEEISGRYREQLVELEEEIRTCGGNKLLEQVATRMREDMDREIQQAVASVEAARQEQLNTLKTRYWKAKQ